MPRWNEEEGLVLRTFEYVLVLDLSSQFLDEIYLVFLDVLL
jgi:hypothetical protein